MEFLLSNKQFQMKARLPVCLPEVREMLDQLRASGTEVWAEVVDSPTLPPLTGRKLFGSLYRLNLIACYAEELTIQEYYHLTEQLEQKPGCSVDVLTKMLGLPDSVQEFEGEFFRLLVGFRRKGVCEAPIWLSLPCEPEQLTPMVNIPSECVPVFYEFQSLLPGITMQSVARPDGILQVNQFARHLSRLHRQDILKLKAVLEAEAIRDDIPAAMVCMNLLKTYELDPEVISSVDYARNFLKGHPELPSVLENKLSDLGHRLLEQVNGRITHYGVVSGRGRRLYTSELDTATQ